MNIELFIALVKERPVLYDLRNPLYKDRREKDKKWREICTAMDITIEVAKNKWRNLKDCFTKHLKGTKTTTGQASAKYFHWQWPKHMEFMKPHLSFASTITNLEQQSSSDVQDTQSSSDVQDTQLSSDAQSTQSTSDAQGTQSSLSLQGTHARSQRRRQVSSDSENTFSNTDRIIQYLENKKNNFDATELIFIGHAKSIKQFSIQRQARIKMNIAKMIAEEEVAHYEETMLRFNQPSPNYLPSPVANTSRSSLSPDHTAQSYIQSQEANTIHNSPFAQVNEQPPNYLPLPVENTSRSSLSPDHNAQSYIQSQEANTIHNSPFAQVNEQPPNYLPLPVENTSRSSLSPDHNAQSYIQSQEANTIHNSPFAQVNEQPPNYLPLPVENTSRSSLSPDHNAQSYIQSQEANTIHNSPFAQVNESPPSHNQQSYPKQSLKSFFTNFN